MNYTVQKSISRLVIKSWAWNALLLFCVCSSRHYLLPGIKIFLWMHFPYNELPGCSRLCLHLLSVCVLVVCILPALRSHGHIFQCAQYSKQMSQLGGGDKNKHGRCYCTEAPGTLALPFVVGGKRNDDKSFLFAAAAENASCLNQRTSIKSIFGSSSCCWWCFLSSHSVQVVFHLAEIQSWLFHCSRRQFVSGLLWICSHFLHLHLVCSAVLSGKEDTL